MRYLATSAMLVAGLTVGISGVYAADSKAPAKDEKVVRFESQTGTIKGSVSQVMPEDKLLIIQGPNKTMYTFHVDPKTGIMVGSSKAKLEDLKQGTEAAVTFRTMRTGNMALKIEGK